MLIKRPSDIRSSEISDKATYLNRRAFIQAAVGVLGGWSARRRGGGQRSTAGASRPEAGDTSGKAR